jgi:RNA polymerase sigma-70 factor (ECF subfamily)
MSRQPETRHSLLLRLRDRDDQQAWHEFFEIYQPLVYRLARARGAQDAEAEDIAQDVMLAVTRAIEQFEVDRDGNSFRSWLATITRNLALNRLRNVKTRPAAGQLESGQLERLPGDLGDERARREFAYEHRRQVFLWAAGQLRERFSERNWNAFWQTCVEGRSVAEVADELGIAAGAVYVARCRVIARLREIVELKTAELDWE